jgi:glycine/D-amino acid oxidase-like deaminating enzyme
LGQTEVRRIARRSAAGFQVVTAGGIVEAREVVVATNGYTPRQFAWQARRVIPFTGYMAATEELSADLLAKVIPARRTVLDSNIDIDFFRPAPDTPRISSAGPRRAGSRPRIRSPVGCMESWAACSPISREGGSAMSGRANVPGPST